MAPTASSASPCAGRRSCQELGCEGFCIVVCCDGRGRTQDIQQSLVRCVGCCCSVLELLSLQQNVTGSRAHTNVFTEQIKAGEKKRKSLEVALGVF